MLHIFDIYSKFVCVGWIIRTVYNYNLTLYIPVFMASEILGYFWNDKWAPNTCAQ